MGLSAAAYRAISAAARGAGSMQRALSRGARMRIRSEFMRLLGLGEAEADRAAGEFFRNYLSNKADVFFYPFMDKSNIGDFALIEGEEHLRAAVGSGRGAVLIHSHMGNPQMLMPAIGHRGYPLCQVGLSPMDVYRGVREITGRRPNPPAYVWLSIKERLERSLPVKFIHIGRSSLKEIYRVLDAGMLVAMTVDGVDEGDGVRGFLGDRTAMFSSGAVRVAYKSGALLLPVFVLRDPDSRHRIVVEPPIEFDPALDRQAAVESAMERFLQLLEGYVRRYPWLYGRFLGFHNDRFFLKDGGEGPNA